MHPTAQILILSSLEKGGVQLLFLVQLNLFHFLHVSDPHHQCDSRRRQEHGVAVDQEANAASLDDPDVQGGRPCRQEEASPHPGGGPGQTSRLDLEDIRF